MADKKQRGQPRMYETPEEMQAKIDEYFNGDGPKTITGLALYLGFADRQSLYDYQGLEDYSCIIKTARTRIESMYEERLADPKPTGAIFALKNMGWRDRQEVEHSGKDGGPIKWTLEVVNAPRLPD